MAIANQAWVPSSFTSWWQQGRGQGQGQGKVPDAGTTTEVGASTGNSGLTGVSPCKKVESESERAPILGSGLAGIDDGFARRDSPCCFRLHLPIGEVAPGDFRMCCGSSAPGRKGRVSSTLGVITHLGVLRGTRVARALLFPLTGRRH